MVSIFDTSWPGIHPEHSRLRAWETAGASGSAAAFIQQKPAVAHPGLHSQLAPWLVQQMYWERSRQRHQHGVEKTAGTSKEFAISRRPRLGLKRNKSDIDDNLPRDLPDSTRVVKRPRPGAALRGHTSVRGSAKAGAINCAAQRTNVPTTVRPVEEHVSPLQDFMHDLLRSRGYQVHPIYATQQPDFWPPTAKQVQDYDLALVSAVKQGDLEAVRRMALSGRRMDACNRHGESILHTACRRGHVQILRFLLNSGGRAHICDDFGRTPLHDACWAKDPAFECVAALMEQDPTLIRVVDSRGAGPLAYVRREHWPAWRRFLDGKKEEYWRQLTPVVDLLLPDRAVPSLAGTSRKRQERAKSEGHDRSRRSRSDSIDCSSSSSTSDIWDNVRSDPTATNLENGNVFTPLSPPLKSGLEDEQRNIFQSPDHTIVHPEPAVIPKVHSKYSGSIITSQVYPGPCQLWAGKGSISSQEGSAVPLPSPRTMIAGIDRPRFSSILE